MIHLLRVKQISPRKCYLKNINLSKCESFNVFVVHLLESEYYAIGSPHMALVHASKKAPKRETRISGRILPVRSRSWYGATRLEAILNWFSRAPQRAHRKHQHYHWKHLHHLLPSTGGCTRYGRICPIQLVTDLLSPVGLEMDLESQMPQTC